MRQAKRILVAGGGITGLSAAFYLRRMLESRGIPAEISVVERSGRFGGKIQTLRRDGFVIEKGPDSFLSRKTPILDLTRELGLEGELAALNPKAKKTYILHNGQLHPMPAGLVLGIPTQLEPFLRTGLISRAGKLRAGMDFLLPRREGEGDESLGDFIERRLGREVLMHIAEPLLAGIYAGDTHSLSLQATFPQFREAELAHGSLILGTVASRRQAAEATAAAAAKGGASASPEDAVTALAKSSMFLTYRQGLSTLVEALLQALEGVRLQTGRGVAGIVRTEGDDHPMYKVTFENGGMESYDAVVMALPTYATAKLLESVPAAKVLGHIPYVSVANVIMAFRAEDAESRLDGSGFLVPRTEGRFITACTWTSSKWLHTAPTGKILLRCYVGRSGAEDWLKLTDEELVTNVRRDLLDMLGLEAEPLFYEITRLPNSMPQYPVGHLDKVKRARKELAESMPGIHVTGAGFHGVGLPDCIRQGKEAAEQLSLYLNGTY